MNLFVTYDEIRNAKCRMGLEEGKWKNSVGPSKKPEKKKQKEEKKKTLLSLLHLHDNGSKRCAIIVRGSTSGYPII